MTIEPQRHPVYPEHTVTRDQVMVSGIHAPAQCANYSCYNPSGFLDSPFCDDCIWKLWAHIDSTQTDEHKELARRGWFDEIHRLNAEDDNRERERQEFLQERQRKGFMTTPGTIYYLRVGNLIKIGYSIDFEQRLKQYPPNVTLLATHPGTRETERQMHHKFLHRVAKGREWFTPCREIDDHIEDVRSQFNAGAA